MAGSRRCCGWDVSNLAGDAILAQLSSLGDAPTATVLASLALIAICGFHRLIPGSRGLSFGELLFIAFVRETGAIPAVLLVTAVTRLTTPVEGLVEIGMWVILLTLVLAPPLTPWVAGKLGVAE